MVGSGTQVIYDQRPKLSDALGTLATTLRSQSMYRDAQARDAQDRTDLQQAAQQKQAMLEAEARAKDYNAKVSTLGLTPQQRAVADKLFSDRFPDSARFLSGPVTFEQNDQQKQQDVLGTAETTRRAEAAQRLLDAERNRGVSPNMTDYRLLDPTRPVDKLNSDVAFQGVSGSATPAGLQPMPPPVAPPMAPPATPPSRPVADVTGDAPALPPSNLANTIRGTGAGTGVGVPPSLVTAESMVGTPKPSDQNRGPGNVPAGWNAAQMAAARESLGVDPTGSQQVTEAGSAETRKEVARKNRVEEGRLASTAASENALRGAQTAEVRQKVKDAQSATNAFTGAASGATGTATANLSGVNPLVKAAIERRWDPAMSRRWKPEQQAAFEAEVQKYDPNFSMAEYPKQLAVKRSFTSGPDSNTVKSINQLVGHLDTLISTFGQIDNTRIPAYNAVGNFLGGQLGNERIQKAKGSIGQAVNAVANEAAKTFHGSGVPAEKEIQEFRNSIGPNTSPAEFKGATQTLMHLMGTAIDQMQAKYRQGVGVQEDFQIIQPRTAKILAKLEKGGVDTSTLAGGAPSHAASPAPPASSGKPLYAATAQQFYNQTLKDPNNPHSGDPAKARQLAIAAGYTVQ